MVDGGGGAPGSATDAMAMAVTGSAPDAMAEAALSGYEPMGISEPGSLASLGEPSGQEGGDPGGDGSERQGRGHGKDGGGE